MAKREMRQEGKGSRKRGAGRPEKEGQRKRRVQSNGEEAESKKH